MAEVTSVSTKSALAVAITILIGVLGYVGTTAASDVKGLRIEMRAEIDRINLQIIPQIIPRLSSLEVQFQVMKEAQREEFIQLNRKMDEIRTTLIVSKPKR